MSGVRMVASILLVMLLAAVGCGSGSSGDSSSSAGTSGSGSVVTAFMNGGTVTAEYFADGEWALLEGVGGTVSNSRLSITLPANYADYYPIIINVTGSTLLTGQDEDPILQDQLSRVLMEGDALDALYVSIFSTIRASVLRESMRVGMTAEQADENGNAVISAAFTSFGFEGSTLTPEMLETINPLTDVAAELDNAIDFEQAQQAAAVIFRTSDVEGLAGLSLAIDHLASSAARVGVQGNGYSQVDFIQYIGTTYDSTPAQIVETSTAKIRLAVQNTFTTAPTGATPIDAQKARQRVAQVTVDTDKVKNWVIYANYTKYNEFNLILPFSESEEESDTLKIGTYKNPDSDRITFQANATGGLKLRKELGGGTPSENLDGLWSGDTYGDGVRIVIPANQAPGDYTVNLHNATAGLNSTVNVKILAQNEVAISDSFLWFIKKAQEKDEYSTRCYLEMDTPDSMIHTPEGASGTFTVLSGGTESVPALRFGVRNIGTSKEMTSFHAQVTLPDGFAFKEGDEIFNQLNATIQTNGTDWACESDWLRLETETLEAGLHFFSLSDAMLVKAQEDKPFTSYEMLLEIFDSNGLLVSSATRSILIATAQGVHTIARFEQFVYSEDGNDSESYVDVGDIPDGAGPDTIMTTNLRGSANQGVFKARSYTWYDLAINPDSDSRVAPHLPKANLHHIQVPGGLGGFSSNEQGTNPVHVLEGTVGIEEEFGTYWLCISPEPTVDPNTWLGVSVGSDTTTSQLNFERIMLKAWYEEDDITSTKISPFNPIVFGASEYGEDFNPGK